MLFPESPGVGGEEPGSPDFGPPNKLHSPKLQERSAEIPVVTNSPG